MGPEIKGKILDGIKHYNEGEYEKALTIFRELSYGGDNDLMALFYLGSTLGSLGRFSEAIASFNSILSINPTHEKALRAKQVFESLERNSIDGIGTGYSQGDIEAPFCPSPATGENCARPSRLAEKDESSIYPDSGNAGHADKVYDKKEGIEGSIYDFLKSSEAERFLATGEGNNPEISNVIDNFGTNPYDKARILELIREGNERNLRSFIRSVRLRNQILDFLADSNTLAPRKYNTIITQIININAEFGLAFLMFNLGEQKYCEIIAELGDDAPVPQDNQNHDMAKVPEKIGVLKVASNFFIGLFSFEKSFENEFNKLKYFQYLFVFLGFIGVLVLIGYGIKNNLFKVDVKATRTTGSGESTTEIHSNM